MKTIKEMATNDETIKEYLIRTDRIPTENFALLGELTSYNAMKFMDQMFDIKFKRFAKMKPTIFI